MQQTSTVANPFHELISRYFGDPVRFVQEVFGATPDEWQARFLNAIARGKRKISVRSGHGVGKTTAAAWAACHHVFTRFPVKVVMTAPTSMQLYDALFAETKKWMKSSRLMSELFEIKSERIELKAAPEECFITARTSKAEQPEALQGVHADYVLLIADEASGIPEPIFDAAAGSMSGHNAVTVLLGNPVRSSGYFYDTHHRLADDWFTMHVSSVDSHRVSRAFINEMKAKYGEESNMYRIRVLGEFPRADDDTVIPAELVELAKTREVAVSPTAELVWGLDVARFGSDQSALVERRGNHVVGIRTWRNLDLMQLCGAVYADYDSRDRASRPAEILVDSIGLGAGVVDRLRELGLPVRGVNVSEAPAVGQVYANLRAELWYKTRAWFETRSCVIPANETLISELVSVKYSFTSGGKILIESKEAMKKRGMPSPNVADALVLTFAGTAATALYGWNPAKRNQPLRRRLKGIV